MNSEKSEEATRILLRRTSIPSWLNDAPPNVPPTRDFLLFLLTNISPPPRGIEMPPTILIKTSFTYITYYKHFALWRDALHPCPSNNTPLLPHLVVLGERRSGILPSAEEGTMVGARCLIEKKRPAVGAGTIFHYILRASITLNNDVHKIPCAACTKFSSGAGFGSHCCKRRSSNAAVPLSGWMLI